jgi:hypothetical protein
MTKIWGPQGWVTLHSVAALFPEHPSPEEIRLIQTWIQCFANTIICPSCQGHFKKMVETYRASRPQMFSSRNELTLFVLRAHNTVNRRLGKKVYTLEESWKILQTWSPDYCRWQRRNYLHHIQQQWASQVSMQGIVALADVKQLNTAEVGYWGTRTLDWSSLQSEFPVSYESLITIPIVEVREKKAPTDLAFDPISVLSAGQTRPFKFKTARIPLSLISK